jgi:hypothetical protein
MITLCIICGQEIEVDIDLYIDELEEGGGHICDECCAMIREFTIKRN